MFASPAASRLESVPSCCCCWRGDFGENVSSCTNMSLGSAALVLSVSCPAAGCSALKGLLYATLRGDAEGEGLTPERLDSRLGGRAVPTPLRAHSSNTLQGPGVPMPLYSDKQKFFKMEAAAYLQVSTPSCGRRANCITHEALSASCRTCL